MPVIGIGDISGAGTGGTLSLSVSEAPPPPTIAMTVDPIGRTSRTGAATITGTVTCTNGSAPSVNVQMTQNVGRFNSVSGYGGSNATVPCDGVSHPWTVTVAPYSGKFGGGSATVHANGFVMCCAQTEVSRTIQLRG